VLRSGSGPGSPDPATTGAQTVTDSPGAGSVVRHTHRGMPRQRL